MPEQEEEGVSTSTEETQGESEPTLSETIEKLELFKGEGTAPDSSAEDEDESAATGEESEKTSEDEPNDSDEAPDDEAAAKADEEEVEMYSLEDINADDFDWDAVDMKRVPPELASLVGKWRAAMTRKSQKLSDKLREAEAKEDTSESTEDDEDDFGPLHKGEFEKMMESKVFKNAVEAKVKELVGDPTRVKQNVDNDLKADACAPVVARHSELDNKEFRILVEQVLVADEELVADFESGKPSRIRNSLEIATLRTKDALSQQKAKDFEKQSRKKVGDDKKAVSDKAEKNRKYAAASKGSTKAPVNHSESDGSLRGDVEKILEDTPELGEVFR